MSNKPNSLFAVYRTTYFNGVCIEVKQPFGFFHTRAEADAKAEALENLTFKNTALIGFSINFHVREETFG